MKEFPLHFPPTQTNGVMPLWKNGVFSIGDKQVSVLEYSSNLAGWNDELTTFHEDNAGDNHFIDSASRQHAISQINRYVAGTVDHSDSYDPQGVVAHKMNNQEPLVKNPVIMEIGCSSGHLLDMLNKQMPNATLIGADIVSAPLIKLAEKHPNIPMLRFDLLNCPLPDNSVDAVILLNVLEHIEDDTAALQQIKRILKPGGIAIIEVPAGPHLYDLYDKALLHFRRYLLSGLKKKVTELDFKIIKKSHLGFFIYPGFWLVKQRNKRMSQETHEKQKQIVENHIRDTGGKKFLHRLMKIELFLGNWINYPTGIRCLLTCVKKG